MSGGELGLRTRVVDLGVRVVEVGNNLLVSDSDVWGVDLEVLDERHVDQGVKRKRKGLSQERTPNGD